MTDQPVWTVMRLDRLRAIKLPQDELDYLEEGLRCDSNLMCRGLLRGNKPANLGWYLAEDEKGYDRARLGHAFRFPGRGDELYCEDCASEIERELLSVD